MARRYELATGELSTFHFGESAAISETIFVPKSPQSAKSDGYLLLTVFDERRNASYLAILDAMHIEGGPIAKVHVDHRVPIGFHGVWRTATVLIYRLGGTSAKGRAEVRSSCPKHWQLHGTDYFNRFQVLTSV